MFQVLIYYLVLYTLDMPESFSVFFKIAIITLIINVLLLVLAVNTHKVELFYLLVLSFVLTILILGINLYAYLFMTDKIFIVQTIYLLLLIVYNILLLASIIRKNLKKT